MSLQVMASSATVVWGVVTNSVSPTTTGPAVNEPSSPSLARQTGRRFFTFPTLISLNGEDRTPPYLMLYIAQPTFPLLASRWDELAQPEQTAAPISIQAAFYYIALSPFTLRIFLLRRP